MGFLRIWAIFSLLFAGIHIAAGASKDSVSFWLMACWVNLTGIAIVGEIRKQKP